MNRHTRIAVVGGSLVGPLMELLLRSVGYTDVTTYEAAPEARPQAGGVIGIRETGFDALAAAGVPLAEVVAYAGKEVITYNIDNRRVTGLRDNVLYSGETTAWDIFHGALDRRVNVHYGKKVVDITDDGLCFEDGSTCEVDLVIFADGRNSTGRKLLAPDRRLHYQGYVVWRGITTPVDGVRGFTRYRNDTHGNLFSITEPMVQGVNTGLTDWTYYQNLPTDRYRELIGASPTRRVFLLPHHFTPTIRQHVHDYAEQYLPDEFVSTVEGTTDMLAVPINDLSLPNRAAYRRGHVRAVLLGDALMTVRPHAGRGVNNGIDQAWALLDHLTRFDDLDTALNRWQVTMIPKILEWVELGKQRARRNGLGMST
jgi:2-polyprenyl-6-methoxyphenol hydroxylase-like FAD-dependent oxidoreductase